MIRACEIGGATPLVRIPESVPGEYPGVILRILDLGAMGVIVPHVDTREEAQAVVDAVKYAPAGRRGMFDVGRQTGYGTRMSAQEYVKRANEETLVVVMIESTEGLANVDDILSVDGVDVVQIGSSDLSASMGFRGDLAAPQVVAAIDRIVAAARKHGVAPGVGSFAGFSPERMRHYLQTGAQFVNITTQGLLLAGVRHWQERLHEASTGRDPLDVVNTLATPAYEQRRRRYLRRRDLLPYALIAPIACCCSRSPSIRASTRSSWR